MAIGVAQLGLLFIAAAWFIQMFDMGKKETRLNKQFVLLYVLGTALLLVDGISAKNTTTNLLNLLALLGSLIVLFKFKH